jgi:3-isopropylmalate/(R)-2-methylmalate dehydratase small subunit
MGLPIFELLECDEINEGDLIKIDLDNGIIHNIDTGKDYKFTPIPEFMQNLIAAGGLINFAKEMLKENK